MLPPVLLGKLRFKPYRCSLLSLPHVLHRLRQGEAIIRPAKPEEKQLVIRFYESLDSETVYMRFLHHVRDFAKYVDMVFSPVNRYGIVAIAVTRAEPGNVIGVGELIAKERSVGEIAVTVAPTYRRQGLGTKLAAYLAYAAHVKGVERLEAYVLSENVAARRIAERLGLTMEYVGMGVYRVRVKVSEVIGKAARLLGFSV
jgi:RimJ/RimL family protein N-acetyltransferase